MLIRPMAVRTSLVHPTPLPTITPGARLGSLFVGSIRISVAVAAPSELVWEHLSDLSSHSDWMRDAVSIVFENDQRRGVGVRMKVPTVVGPLRVTDLMEVDEWTEGKSIGVRRLGRVSGEGRFQISSHPGGSTLTLTESLRFPWYLGGALTGWFARPILRRVFRSNLVGFADRVEALL